MVLGLVLFCSWLIFQTQSACSAELQSSDAQRGYRLILDKPYLIPDFTQELLDHLWERWSEPHRTMAAQANEEQRRQLTFEYYGLTPRLEDPTKPLQYVVGADGSYTMNCFACHGGMVEGKTYPGAPNNRIALQQLTVDIRATKIALKLPLSSRDVSSLIFPMGGSAGTTNAVMFGVALEHYRDPEMNVVPFRSPPRLVHHDMDAPAWWHYHRKSHLYLDGFVQKSHRALMPFVLIRENGRDQLDEWEQDYRDISAYLETIRPPQYPYPIDHELAEQGRELFTQHCADCHGTYGEERHYPEAMIDIADISTDPVRLQALTPENRTRYRDSWLADYGALEVVTEPIGYVAPPLDGIWASAPYFHNGSVPTLLGVLDSSHRPEIWVSTGNAVHQEEVGLQYEPLTPDQTSPEWPAFRVFDSRKFSKSRSGHKFGD
ncbi:MAG: c-type cytochrome, partial [Planctomycetaceae bacterium]|nr:c-type cytochrome [Planctomycetaceae bacterium]